MISKRTGKVKMFLMIKRMTRNFQLALIFILFPKKPSLNHQKIYRIHKDYIKETSDPESSLPSPTEDKFIYEGGSRKVW